MAVTIRLARHGCTHRPFYHIVAADHRKARNGRFIEKLGYYDPNHKPSIIEMKNDRVEYWFSKGASMSDTVTKLAKIQKVNLSRKPQG